MFFFDLFFDLATEQKKKKSTTTADEKEKGAFEVVYLVLFGFVL